MIAEVIVDISNPAVDRIFDYIAGYDIKVGCRVLVPFNHKETEGYVIALKEDSEYLDKLKEIIRPMDDFLAISSEMIDLMWYMKGKYNLKLADILHLFIPSKLRGNRVRVLKRNYALINSDIPLENMLNSLKANSDKQKDLLIRLSINGEFVNVLRAEYGAYSVKALMDRGYIKVEEITVGRVPFKNLETMNKTVALNEDQITARDNILEGFSSKYLLHGVTGSGKTEVYLSIIKETVEKGRTVILLVPEISLTPQMLMLLRGRFGDSVAIMHSGLNDGERLDEWLRIESGEARIVVGARSAIFAPLKDIGAIIMDEEHEQSYLSESNPRYSAQDIAVWRADYHYAKLILGSATPSIESYTRSLKGELQLIELRNRVNDIKMPEIEIIDMCDELRQGNKGIFSGVLENELIECINAGNQAMIYINRRGHSSFVMCRKCGNVLKCTDCDVSLTYHKADNLLKCHYCGKRYTMITNCPTCGSDNIRFGRVGTQQVVNEINRILPHAKVIRMDTDTTRTKTAYYDILDDFRKRNANILVGTQMIAKGHDFPEVTVVGILDADLSLYHGDYMSAERTFQLITQVAGRAGRGKKSGRVLLQTYSPRHYIFSFARLYDYKGFYDKESNIRKVTNFPPFAKIIRILLLGKEEKDVINLTRANYMPLKQLESEYKDEFIYMQAMKAPVNRIENKYRYQILIRIRRDKEEEIIHKIYAITNANTSKEASLFVEINPNNLN